MKRLLQKALSSFIRSGNLRVAIEGGSHFSLGDGQGPLVAVRLSSPAVFRRLLLDPELRLGEAYMDGSLTIEQGSLVDLITILLTQQNSDRPPYFARIQWLCRYLKRRLAQINRPTRARRNVAHHYDLDGRLYALFLDADRQYSCAYFDHPEQSLDDAQLAKKRHLAAKLLVRPDHRILEIGSGWGGLSLYLADHLRAQMTGITLSEEQFKSANDRARERQLSERAHFLLQDYRDSEGSYDRIVSVGMFEHVGVGYYDVFFRKAAQLLADDGVMLLHSIGRSEGPNVTNPWIAKYIFPGGYIPALSEVLPAIERAGLLVTDIEILRLHYAETLKAWRERFLAHADDVRRIYDERFLRMWEFYLVTSEMTFREQNMMVFQIQLAKKQGVVPITRDYIGREEARLRVLEAKGRTPLRLAGE